MANSEAGGQAVADVDSDTDGQVAVDVASAEPDLPVDAANVPDAAEPVIPILLNLAAMIAIGTLAWIALFANEQRSSDVDPQFMRLLAERTSRFGGTYYQNSLHNKGPFDALLYHIPREVLGFDAYWYGISFFILVGTALLAFAAARTTLVHDVPKPAAMAIGIVAFFHFALVRADYAGVLYSRNETAYMLAAVWLIVLAPSLWTARRSLRSMVAIGALFGLAAQTLLSTAIESAVIGLLVVWVVRDRVDPGRRLRHVVVGAVTAALVLVAAPIWYALRGSFDEFWAGWWTYASFQSSATDLTMVDKFQRGWDNMTKYYGDFPLSLIIVAGFAGVTWLFWKQLSRFQRAVHVTAFGWLVAGWLELVLSWRYSSHYFAVVAVPTMFIAALLMGHGLTLVARVRPLKLAPLFPVFALVVCFLYFHDNRVDDGYDSIRHYNSPAELVRLRNANNDAHIRTVRAILDVISAADDPLLMWTNSPSPYLDVRRVPASRMAWYTFFEGNIYLGRKGPEYVLPQTWEWFAQDMAQTHPAAEWEVKAVPHDPDLPFADYVETEMRLLYDGATDNVFVRNDLADAVADPFPGDAATEPVDVPASLSADTRIDLGSGHCRAVSLTLEGDTSAAMVTFHLGGTDFADRTLALGEQGTSGKDSGEVTDTATLPGSSGGMRRVSVVVGDRSALMVVDGVIAGAVELIADVPTLSMVVDQDGLVASDVQVGGLHWPSNC